MRLDASPEDDYFGFDAIWESNFVRGCGRAAGGIRFRLRCNGKSGAGDAMLRFDAVLSPEASGAGLLQDNANDARSVCKAGGHSTNRGCYCCSGVARG